jgi:hypothetical protein
VAAQQASSFVALIRGHEAIFIPRWHFVPAYTRCAMTYQLETEGGFWGSLPKVAQGNVQDLAPPHQQALATLFATAKEYQALPAAAQAADLTKYTITLQQAAHKQVLAITDAQLKYLPAPVAAAIIHLSNNAT